MDKLNFTIAHAVGLARGRIPKVSVLVLVPAFKLGRKGEKQPLISIGKTYLKLSHIGY